MNYKRKLDHFVTDDSRISNLKQQERSLNNKDKSRHIERRRRLLTEEEGRRKGPPPEDHRIFMIIMQLEYKLSFVVFSFVVGLVGTERFL
jgi:hypothetical protein